MLWDVLSKKGSSSTEERKALFGRFLGLVPVEKIHAFVADREFISAGWLEFLADSGVPFIIRIRSGRHVTLGEADGPDLPACMFFRGLALGNERRLAGQRFVGGQPVNVMGKRLNTEDDEFLILIASPGVDASGEASDLYRRRWEKADLMRSAQTLFAAMESQGFDLVATHVTGPERVAKLIGLLALAFVWSHLIGQKRHEKEPLEIKKHGWPERSLFRYGLDLLQSIMLNLTEKKEEFRRCVRLLAAPSKFFVV